ncbi:MAG TPA: SRPBCC domain-containing protein [Chitinophaga sp.]|uniref:SRPBCC domain-containing protein n=1 Tax=Chitinophaga sp. TaxID=1869181 RepID=UPI002C95B949|nr:SRPBCC domain-containing protein [Chitinophaga sp.]HVI46868.1 SRPBCC domain-containing protein [Chitinophaga sp.]
MSNPLFVKNSITINASVSKVWNALVNPEETKKYMFNCETVSDWKIGSTLQWKTIYEGKEFIAVEGTILELEPERKLVYTTIDPHAGIDLIPENYLRVTYELSPSNGTTTLNVSQGDYSKVAEGEKRYNDTVAGGGWSSILEAIKTLVEGA